MPKKWDDSVRYGDEIPDDDDLEEYYNDNRVSPERLTPKDDDIWYSLNNLVNKRIPITIVEIISETKKAWHIETIYNEIKAAGWFPKSNCRLNDKTISVPIWLWNIKLSEMVNKNNWR